MPFRSITVSLRFVVLLSFVICSKTRGRFLDNDTTPYAILQYSQYLRSETQDNDEGKLFFTSSPLQRKEKRREYTLIMCLTIVCPLFGCRPPSHGK